MDIVELDAAALADDAVMRDYYDLSRRAELLGREQAPFWTLEEFVGAFRSEDSGERQQLFAAFDGDRMIGFAVLWSPLLDNPEKACFGLDVDPPDRRRGVGRALARRGSSSGAKADNRTLVLTDSKIPFEERETHGYRRSPTPAASSSPTSRWSGTSRCRCPTSGSRRGSTRPRERHEGYTIETFVDEFPDELVESLCVLLGQLAVDAPTGPVDFEEEAMTPAAATRDGRHRKAMGRSRYETLALSPDRLVVAQSTLACPWAAAPTSSSGAPSCTASTAGTARPRDEGRQPPRRAGARAPTSR